MDARSRCGLFWFVGFACGALAWNSIRVGSDNCSRLSDELVLAEVGNLGGTLAALSALDTGNHAAGREVLEASLATSAVVLDEWRSALRSSESESIEKSLEQVRLYQKRHPLFLSKDESAKSRLAEVLRPSQ
jgi:hypothetical protein